MKKSIRLKVWNKYNQHCAYCGNLIQYADMQVDHFIPKRLAWWWRNLEKVLKYKLRGNDVDHFSNLMPSCRSCNHYKSAELIESFRVTMKTLYKRIVKTYLVKVAITYKLIEFHPWDEKFYYEKCLKRTKNPK